ncbi:hypothetical protein [Salinigranum salinum]|uniref:hypothetical protein n=1 Tax=Salinigranum salinum TaxID=1364937 RepID=UPI0012607DE4|nr:hypothetical protein [Salinigranum salinum]
MNVVREFLNACMEDIDEHGVRGLSKTLRSAGRYVSNEFRYRVSHAPEATNVYDREWDLLILLDCATVDMMEEVRDEYEFVGTVGEHISPGTCSDEWMNHTFTGRYRNEMARTLHVTANTSSERRLDADRFLHLEEVWRDGWDADLGTIPARTVTDRAISLTREYDADRTIVHYMQPHLPFVEADIDGNVVTPVGVEGEGYTLGELHDECGYRRDELWEASVENLRYVLDDVAVLLDNVDADTVVVSSDHGQAFGEDGVWSHPCYTYVDVLKTVPWCVTSASDTGTRRPSYEPADESESDPQVDLDEKLAALGYK